jgi:cystathionine beta-lyase/cystathionine gamma-synthase
MVSLNAAAAVASLPVEEQVSVASAGAEELKQAAKRVREAKRKTPAPEVHADVDASATPTLDVLRERVAALEGGTAALAVASGHAAEFLVFHTLMQPGDEFVASTKLYGGSINQFNHAYKNFNWTPKWADPDDLSTFEAAIGPRTKAIFIESIANPGGAICDIGAIAKIA